MRKACTIHFVVFLSATAILADEPPKLVYYFPAFQSDLVKKVLAAVEK